MSKQGFHGFLTVACRGIVGALVGGFAGAVCQGFLSGLLAWLGELEETAKWVLHDTVLGTINGAFNGSVLGLCVVLVVNAWGCRHSMPMR